MFPSPGANLLIALDCPCFVEYLEIESPKKGNYRTMDSIPLDIVTSVRDMICVRTKVVALRGAGITFITVITDILTRSFVSQATYGTLVRGITVCFQLKALNPTSKLRSTTTLNQHKVCR